MKVTLVAASSSTAGGGEKHVADLMRRLPARGLEVSVVCPPGGDLAALAASLGLRLELIDLSGGDLTRVPDLRRALRRLDPDVVHAHGSRAAFYARLADRSAEKRCVYSVHGIHVDVAGSALRRTALLTVERYLRDRTALFVCVCRSDAGKGARLGITDPERTVVVYNGIEAPAPGGRTGAFRAELGVDASAPLVLSIGRLHAQKDHDTLLRAWAQVIVELPDARLALVGKGPLSERTALLRNELGLTESVRIVAPRPGIAEAYRDADVFALSSRWEGFPYVVVEAMAYELAVVSTNVDGVPEAVEDGTTGLLVPPSDPAALAGALRGVLGDPELRARLGAAARERALSAFTLDGMVDGLLVAYERVAGAV